MLIGKENFPGIPAPFSRHSKRCHSNCKCLRVNVRPEICKDSRHQINYQHFSSWNLGHCLKLLLICLLGFNFGFKTFRCETRFSGNRSANPHVKESFLSFWTAGSIHLALRVNAFDFAGNTSINASHAQNLFINFLRVFRDETYSSSR